MPEDQSFQERMAHVEGLIRQLERTSDPAVRASVKELMQGVMDLHGTALNRLMEIVEERSGEAAIKSLGQDPLTASLLILYGLHPEDTETRVGRAVEKLAVTFRRYGANIALESVNGSVVQVRIDGVANATAGRALKKAVEEGIYAFAPDVTRVDGLDVLGASELISVAALTGASAGTKHAF
jgi:hypothetical protein